MRRNTPSDTRRCKPDRGQSAREQNKRTEKVQLHTSDAVRTESYYFFKFVFAVVCDLVSSFRTRPCHATRTATGVNGRRKRWSSAGYVDNAAFKRHPVVHSVWTKRNGPACFCFVTQGERVTRNGNALDTVGTRTATWLVFSPLTTRPDVTEKCPEKILRKTAHLNGAKEKLRSKEPPPPFGTRTAEV